jgi:hypothetical protein
VTTRARVGSTGILTVAPDRVTLLRYIDQVSVSMASSAEATELNTHTGSEHLDHHLVLPDVGLVEQIPGPVKPPAPSGARLVDLDGLLKVISAAHG